MSQQPGFHEKMLPSRMRVLGEGRVLWAEITFAVLLSGVEVTTGIVMLPQPTQWTNLVYTLLPAFLLLPPQFIHLLSPDSLVHPSSSLAAVNHGERGYEGQAQIQFPEHLAWRTVLPAAWELSMVLPRLGSDAQVPLPVAAAAT